MREAAALTTPYTRVKDKLILSVRRNCKAVDAALKSTHVEDVATAIAGSVPINMKTGAKIVPPPMPTRPAKQPASDAVREYVSTWQRLRTPSLTRTVPYTSTVNQQVDRGTIVQAV